VGTLNKFCKKVLVTFFPYDARVFRYPLEFIVLQIHTIILFTIWLF